MVNVRIDEDTMLDMLMDRLSFWTEDDVYHKLFEQYYYNLIYGGCFDGIEFDVMEIVDNDYVNWLDVITKEDFENYNIEDENDYHIETSYNDGEETYYLINCS